MAVIKFILKLILKLLLMPIILILGTVILMAKIAGHIGAYILSLLVLIILGCFIFCLVKMRWTDAAIVFGMEAAIVFLMFCGTWIASVVNDFYEFLLSLLYK